VTEIDAATRGIVRTIPVPAGALAISSNGTDVWVTGDNDGNWVTEIDAATGNVVGNPIPVGNSPENISADTAHVWVANFFDNTVTEIDAATRAVVGTPISVGARPYGISSDGGHVWVADSFDSTVTEIDASSGGVVGCPISVGGLPDGISSDGSHVWTANNGDGTVSEFSTAIAGIVPGAPAQVVAVPGSRKATISWTPASSAGCPVTGYVATATPGGKTCSSTGASCTMQGLTNGTRYTVVVKASNAAGTGPASTPSRSFTPGAPVSVTLKLSSNKLTYGHEASEKISVVVKARTGSVKPTGTVVVSTTSPSTAVCTVTLSSGVGSCTVAKTQLAVGSYSLVAAYAGSSTFASTQSAGAKLAVVQAATATTLKLSSATVKLGSENTETLSYSIAPQYAGNPTGSVTIGTPSVTICAMTVMKPKGTCTLSASQLPAGTYKLVATYGGNQDFKGSLSKTETLTVKS
jgi:YVTN family beta-propeller protein